MEETINLLIEENKTLRWKIETLEQQLENSSSEQAKEVIEQHYEEMARLLDETILDEVLATE